MGRGLVSKFVATVVVVATMVGSSVLAAGAAPATPGPTDGSCLGARPAVVTGRLSDGVLTEASGLVASRRNPGVYWSHNDNGSDTRLVALDVHGAVLAVHHLDIQAGNLEDISFGPGPDGSDEWIYLGDVGDNRYKRPYVRLYRFREPKVDLGARRVMAEYPASQIEVFRVRYQRPDQPSATWSRDVEAFAIDPVDNAMFIFEKKWNAGPRGDRTFSHVYRLDLADVVADGDHLAEPVGFVKSNFGSPSSRGFTAADISRDGSLLILKNRQETMAWVRQQGQSIDDVLADEPVAPCLLPSFVGEALAIDTATDRYLMVRESARSSMVSVDIVPPRPATPDFPYAVGLGGPGAAHTTGPTEVVGVRLGVSRGRVCAVFGEKLDRERVELVGPNRTVGLVQETRRRWCRNGLDAGTVTAMRSTPLSYRLVVVAGGVRREGPVTPAP